MKRSNRLVILVGLLLAALAFAGIVVVLNQGQAAQQVATPKETVLVATETIAIGDPVTADVVETREVALGAAVQTPLRDVSQVQGQPALFEIPAGSQVTQEALGGGTGTANIAAQLAEGERAISFVVDRVQGVDFLVQPGDRIDVVAAFQIPPTLQATSESVRTVKTVLQNRRVLYVSNSRIQAAPQASPATDGGAAPAPEFDTVVIVIAGTDQDAEVIRYAQRTTTDTGDQVHTTLSIALRGANDTTTEETTGISIEELLGEYGVPIPDLADLAELVPSGDEESQPAP